MGRKRIGLIYSPTSNWIAGSYYVLNIVHALKMCDDSDRPVVVVFCHKEEDYYALKELTGYPYLRKRLIFPRYNVQYSYCMRAVRKLTKIDLGDLERIPTIWDRVEFIYPFSSIGEWQNVKSKCLGWIPDFQEKYLTEYFDEKELSSRFASQRSFFEHNVPIVFSSKDAQNDFYKFHPDGINLKTFVLPFAVTHSDFSGEDINQLKQKFGIKKQYLFVANQFWAHKNHLFLFRAFAKAKEQGLDLQLVCSGKLHDYRNDGYADTVRNYLQENHLEQDILILGFIERTEQLCLMKHSYAMVQPSLFEGWSTVVEDAKCLNKFIFLSNLRVHFEQDPRDVCYFDPRNEDDLAEKLLTVKPTSTVYDYSQDVKKFGQTFVDIIRNF